jgi:pimeloyl-ACP methyl ester carboxylesterase
MLKRLLTGRQVGLVHIANISLVIDVGASYYPPVTDTDFTVAVPGGIIAGVRSGRGDLLLVLHGGPGVNDYTGIFADELAGWTTLRYTQRGVSPSTATGPFTVGQHAADAIAVLDQNNVSSAVVVGHSWGGFLAMQVAAAAPERVTGLVLVDSLGVAGDGGSAAFAAEMDARLGPEVLAEVATLDELAEASPGTPESDAAAVKSFNLMWPGYFADPASAPPPPADMRFSPECYTGTFESIQAAQAGGQLVTELAGYPGPVEIVAGGASPFPTETATAIAALFSDAHLTVEPGAGHIPSHERPGCVTAALSRLAGRLAS